MTAEKILVVDDDTEILKLLSELFTRTGFDVVTVNNGAAALDVAKKDGCSVAIVDLEMPGQNGIDTVQQMKKVFIIFFGKS